MPRLGFAFNFMPKTVMHGGFGIFHRTVTQNNLATGLSIGTGYINTLSAGQFPSSRLTGPYSLEDPWPGGVIRPAAASRDIETNLGTGPSYDPPNRLNNSMLWCAPVSQVTDVDRSHNLTFAGIWDLPFGKGRAFLTT